ncbi:Coagulation factor XIII A chain-like [Oopsacas minuta]|uniref:Coagulation factor XIII A chain-like n=1 Tax=Oopsacas minuta TaxID=111878 RepID=A0AAV7JRT1_9METZ|nr:Coagulation factor XIII A chain-like [Oopsacas minuta]
MLNCTIHSVTPLPHAGQVRDFFPKDSSLVLRRGQSFRLQIVCSAISGAYDISISFTSFYNPTQTYGEYNTRDFTQTARQIVLEVKIPYSFPIGKFSLSIKLTIREDREVRFSLVSPSLIVLFNPSSYDDVTYYPDTLALRYYHRADCGVIFRGTQESPEEYPWHYAQYSDECLEVAMRIISNMTPVEAADVIKVCQHLTSRINPFNQLGIFKESYSGISPASISPAQWNSSLPPFKRYLTGKYPPLPGECWTLSGVLVSLLRCVGIPARPVSCYNAAHQCKKLGRNDKYFIHQVGLVDSLNKDLTWVYHVWVEAWISSWGCAPSWHVLDPSAHQQSSGPFRTGPISVSSIANYKTFPICDHSVECVAGEVNYSCYTFRVAEISVLDNCWKFTLVKIEDQSNWSQVVTMNESHMLQDITDTYKLDFGNPIKHTEDILFETFSETNLLEIGTDLKFGIRVKNLSDFTHKFEGMVSVDSILYTLRKLSHVTDFHFSGSLGPHKSKEFNYVLKYYEYSSHLQHQCFLRLVYQAQTNEISPSQILLTSLFLRVKGAALTIQMPTELKLNAQYRIKISFRNPIPSYLTHVTIHLNNNWLMKEPQELKFRRAVKPDEEISVIGKLHPICVGVHNLYATLTSVELSNVYVTQSVNVINP